MYETVNSQIDFVQFFSPQTITRAGSYQRNGRVIDYRIIEDSAPGLTIISLVRGTDTYSQRIVLAGSRSKGIDVGGNCSCPVSYNCKHVAAVLFEMKSQGISFSPQAQPKSAHESIPREIESWLKTIEQPKRKEKKSSPQVNAILYTLRHYEYPTSSKLEVSFHVARELKIGGYGKPRSQNIQSAMTNKVFTEEDRRLCFELEYAVKRYGVMYRPSNSCEIPKQAAKNILQRLIKTGRCYWHDTDDELLTWGDDKQASFEWGIMPDGSQMLTCSATNEGLFIIPASPPLYIDPINAVCGLLKTEVDEELLPKLLNAPVIAPEHVNEFFNKVEKKFANNKNLLPRKVQEVIDTEVVVTPKLHLFGKNFPMIENNYAKWGSNTLVPLGKVTFIYGEEEVGLFYDSPFLTRVESNTLVKVQRDLDAEYSALDDWEKCEPKVLRAVFDEMPEELEWDPLFLIGDVDDNFYRYHFIRDFIPELRSKGWVVEIDDSFPTRIIDAEVDWYTDINEHSDNHWFDMELGIEIEGEKINLLPIMVNLVKHLYTKLTSQEFQQLPEDDTFLLPLEDGRCLPLPVGRVRNIFNLLTELYDHQTLDKDGRLSLNALRAGDLLEIEKALGSAKLRWLGGERLQKLAKKLKSFDGIKAVKVPKRLKATLRPYQQQGLNWLQFLREYELSGILADDMGLGKTIQSLAHIQIEKQSGRMEGPNLVIAPTSVIHNWQNEAAKFLPSLKVLVLHGPERSKNFHAIADHELVITTYPLLLRDKEALLEHEFHCLILDEAQVIKNPRAKVTQIAQQLRAKHRLCLTGTPMENNLGELWSLFHFVSPGLLGEQIQFNRIFRKPIEGDNDNQRRKILAKRVAPFMLRRTKDLVATELPPKTEINRTVEMETAQRDLYESIRVSMQQKVAKAIGEKGVARSQIVILDALLKLRQICCDPRLLKLKTAQKVKRSAKLEHLMEFLPELIAEGRRILLFSSFTQMLKLIEDELSERNIDYVKLTGQTRDRKTPIDRFQNGEVPLFLISLKAGGTGLNLTAADVVIHYDPWWNPATENQATDRAHRIGQDKSVFVYKLITAGSVEEKIVSMQQKKNALLQGLFSEQADTKVKLTANDLEFLFKPLDEE